MNILELAKQAGVLAGYEGEPDKLERFAALIRQQERERCAAVCLQLAQPDAFGTWDAAMKAGIEQCAAAIRGMNDE